MHTARERLTGLTVGVDMVTVSDVQASIDTFGQRYLDRVFTAGEQADCAGDAAGRSRSLAARFAAKEATRKALHAPDLPGAWTDVEIVRSPGGWPTVALHGAVRRHAGACRIDDIALSFSHDHDRATAVAVAVAVVAPGAEPHGPAPTDH